MTDPQLVLASSSPYRRALLDRLGRDFICRSPAVDETAQRGESAEQLVARLARAKVEAVARDLERETDRHGPGYLIIGSDQVASLNGDLLTKPGTHERAAAQLRACGGRTATFHTAVTVRELPSGREITRIVDTRVTFRQLGDRQIEHYLQREQPYDCAGGFKVEGLGIVLFERIVDDDPTALIGLPLITLTGLLTQLGLSLL